MGVTGTKKEMLFILGQFFNKTNRRFSKFPLDVSVSKAEFIDVIRGMKAVSKTERALYRNLEVLQKEKYLVYGDRDLKMSRKGFLEYERVRKEVEHFRKISDSVEAGRIKFKRKTQTRLKV
jgi:hypothetical protein